MPERFSRSLGRPRREQTLPWDISSIVSVRLFRPAAGVSACGSACAEGVTASTRPGGGISGTAKTRSAGSSCAAGRRPSGSNSGVSSRKFAKRMRQRSVSGVPGGVPQALAQKVRPGDEEATPEAKPDEGRGAWSRSKKFSAPFCDRPGCYDAVRPSCRCQARYCSDDCRQAVQRVRDRERKWLNRHTLGGTVSTRRGSIRQGVPRGGPRAPTARRRPVTVAPVRPRGRSSTIGPSPPRAYVLAI